MSTLPDPQAIKALVALFQSGQLAHAKPLAQALTQQFPAHPFGWTMLGAILRGQKQNRDALQPMMTAAKLAPHDASLQFNVGNNFRDLGELETAVSWYSKAAAVDPQFMPAYYQLANAQYDLGQLQAAERNYQHALRLHPPDVRALSNLAHLQQDTGQHHHAFENMQRALAIEPDNALLHFNLSDLLHDQGRLREAHQACARALELQPGFVPALCNMGVILGDLGDSAGALASYRRALELSPDDTNAQSGLLFLLNYSPLHSSDLRLREALHFGRMVGGMATSAYDSWHCATTPDRLRIGFVSGDLREHSVGYFLENVLSQLDPSQLDLVAFPTNSQSDALTQRIHPYFSHWIPLTGLPDAVAAERIHEMGVHILIDLSGHTTHNRLPMFALRPAPVQATWLGYFATTGVEAMDFLIADPWSLPPDQEAFFTEKIWRLPSTRMCFTPPNAPIAVNALPMQNNGAVTFGCFNNLNKINSTVVALWSRILKQVPNSRLLLKARQFQDPQVAKNFSDQFVGHGVEISRVTLEGPSDRKRYLETYHRVDIGLDPFPFPGGTTTVESLWMGVPVLTLAGSDFLSRQGVGLMTAAGLANWIASDADDYVAKAVSHAANAVALSRLRQGLRSQVLASALFDAKAFARDFEAALHGMWKFHLESI
jgi:predicted O-linked N-acetylglucosamine transferase (SPINDLY family)